MMIVSTVVAVLSIAVVVMVLAYAVQRRMTLCLTFDDGLKTHYEIVAPLLEKYGWRGCFSVPTAFIAPAERAVTEKERIDFCVCRKSDIFMSWENVVDLGKRGHLIVPHTAHHVNLRELEQSGDIAALESEIMCSVKKFEQGMGSRPKYFCFPHNASSVSALNLLRRTGVKPFLCPREDFGGGTGFSSKMKIRDWILSNEKMGAWHLDIMVHGVDADLGGWRSFGGKESFDSFLHEIKQMEDEGKVQVLPFASAHLFDCSHSKVARKFYRVVCRIRRELASWKGLGA